MAKPSFRILAMSITVSVHWQSLIKLSARRRRRRCSGQGSGVVNEWSRRKCSGQGSGVVKEWSRRYSGQGSGVVKEVEWLSRVKVKV